MKLFRQPLKLGLRARITLLIEGLVVLLVVSTGIITTMREKDTLESQLRKRGLALAVDLSKFMAGPLLANDLPILRRFVLHTMDQDNVRYVFVTDPHGRVIMHSDLAEVGKIYSDDVHAAAAGATGPGSAHLSNQGERHCDLSAPIQISDVKLGTVRMGYSYAAVETEIARARQQILIIGLVTTLVGGVAAYVLATFISAPVKRITEATREVAAGNLDTRLQIERNDEIGALADAFNRMTVDLRRTTISRDYVDNIIGSMNDTLVVVDLESKITNVNRATCELLGYEKHELIGKDMGLIVPGEEEIFRGSGSQRLPGRESLANRELDYLTRSGGRIPVLFSAAVLKNKEGRVIGAVGIARDITERRRAEEALRKSERELRFLSSQLLYAQEKERRRLSIELHDELGQALMVLKLKLRSIREGLRPEQRRLQAACDGLLGHINDVSENIRRLSRDLSPYILEDLGLSAAIRWLVKKSCKHGNLESSLDMTALEDLFTRERQITVYRIVQECLTNIAKHAQATRVYVTITKQGDRFFFRVEDNGKGFDVREVLGRDPRTKGLGLAAMHERTRMLKGSLDIRSHRGTGTQITFSVPLDMESVNYERLSYCPGR